MDHPMLIKYASRYVPLLVLAVLLFSIRYFISRSAIEAQNAPPSSSSYSYSVGEQALYDLTILSSAEGWAVGGSIVNRIDTNGRVLQVISRQGLIWHYAAGSWTNSTTIALPLLSVAMTGTQDGWAVGYGGELMHYDGHAWTGVSSPTQVNLRAVVALSIQDAWAVGSGGMILHYDGTNWREVASPVHANLSSISMPTADDGWIVGDGGTLLHYQGQHWVQVASPTRETLNRVTMLSADEGWAVGANETILHYRDGTWESVDVPSRTSSLSTSGTGSTLYDIGMTSPGSGWIVGTANLLYYNHEIWSPIQSGMLDPAYSSSYGTGTLYSLIMLSAQEGWAIGEANDNILILHYQAGVWHHYY
ncbi:MAG TPA: hypothetical protein VH593_07580 [Ktedonobacteraceae bacterium]|jgi:hypothetical protein